MNFMSTTYHIRNKRSGLYLTVAGCSPLESATLEQQPLPLIVNVESFTWYVCQINNGRYLIVNMKSLLYLNVSGNDTTAGAAVEQNELQLDDPSATHAWLIDPHSGNHYTIQNDLSRLFLSVSGCSIAPGAAIHMWKLQNSSNFRDSQLWKLEVEHAFPLVPMLPLSGEEIECEISNREFEAGKTVNILIGQVAIPFALVGGMASCYFNLRRYTRWRMLHRHVPDERCDGLASAKFGVITDNEVDVLDIVGFTVLPDESVVLGNVINLYREQLVNGLGIKVARAPNRYDTLPRNLMVTFTSSNRVIESIWANEHRYELTDTAGDRVLRWKTRSFKLKKVTRHINSTRPPVVVDVPGL